MRKSRWWKVAGIDSGELVENRKQRAGVRGELLDNPTILCFNNIEKHPYGWNTESVVSAIRELA